MKKLLFMAMLLLGSAGYALAQNTETKNFEDITFIAPEPCIMIGTYDAKGNPDVMMAAWGSQCERNQIMIHLSHHQTTANLEVTKAFTVSFATENTVAESDYFGSVSEKEAPGKVKTVGFTAHKAPHVNAPVIDQYPVTLECKVVSWKDGILVGEVVNTIADKSVLDKAGNIDFALLKPVVFDGVDNTYRALGPVVGKAWNAGDKFKK